MPTPESRFLARLRTRLLVFGLMVSLWIVAIAGRLGYLQIVERSRLQDRAELQQQDTLQMHPARGTIFDRNGRELALSVEMESIYAVPKSFTAAERDKAAEALSRCLLTSKSSVVRRLTGTRSFVWLKRKAPAPSVACIRELHLPGVGFLPESRRFYPKRNIAAHVLGYVGIDNEGLGGVELAMEPEIRGVAGRQMIWTDARKRRTTSRIETRAVAGRSVYLTIDENLQYMVEDELRVSVESSRASAGIAILMRSSTGEVLAMASQPTFNPNRYDDYPNTFWRNRVVTDPYEPGSTFKIVTAAAAIEEGVVNEDERIDCGGGSIQIGGQTIGDSRVFDVMPFRDVVAHSSNVGMIRIGQRLGAERFGTYVRRFGFGEKTRIELQAESRGILRPFNQWGPLSLASISFGQEIAVTPMQMVAAANVIAADGYLLKPKLVLGPGDPSPIGQSGPIRAVPEPVRRVVSQDTARRLGILLEGTVRYGTGQRAAVAGYRVAGKTGTAQKVVDGQYSKTDYVASFVGFAPAERAELTALVILDSPRGDHSGGRAAQVFSRIVERALRYLGTPRDDETLVRVRKTWPSHLENDSMRTLPAAADGSKTMPNLLGFSARDAVKELVRLGVQPNLEGTGWVLQQSPPAGTSFESGERCRLRLGEAGAYEKVVAPTGEVKGSVVRVGTDSGGV